MESLEEHASSRLSKVAAIDVDVDVEGSDTGRLAFSVSESLQLSGAPFSSDDSAPSVLLPGVGVEVGVTPFFRSTCSGWAKTFSSPAAIVSSLRLDTFSSPSSSLESSS